MRDQSNPTEKLRVLYEQMQLLSPLLLQTRELREILQCLVRFADQTLPFLNRLGLVRLDNRSNFREMCCWGTEGGVNDPLFQQFLDQWLGGIIERLQNDGNLDDEELMELFQATCQDGALDTSPTLFPLRYGSQLIGLAFFGKNCCRNGWSNEEKQVLLVLSSIVGISFANQNLHEDYILQSWAFNAMMDRMQTNLYVTDPHTHRILFMNETMKRSFGVNDVEGQYCWDVLQRGMTGPCPFCKVSSLLNSDQPQPHVRWEERNTRTGRIYRNYDSLMTWIDGSLVHFQHSEDVTDSKLLSRAAATDELTGLLNRRGGQERLQQALATIAEGTASLVVCMYDVNSLKQVNDSFGHREGDRLLQIVAQALQSCLQEQDFVCRLSGDEFLSVFYGLDESGAAKRIFQIRQRMREARLSNQLPYEVGFCCGSLVLQPGTSIQLPEVLRVTDTRMYEEKRRYHQQLHRPNTALS